MISLASVYGAEELELDQTVLISTILLVQFMAFAGALLLGRLARVLGTKRVVLASLVVWTFVVVAAFFLQAGAATQFYLLGALIAIVLGGSQALSRSLFSLLIPHGREAEYFGFYEISDKGTSWIGPLVFGARTAGDRLVPVCDRVAGHLLRRRLRAAARHEPAEGGARSRQPGT